MGGGLVLATPRAADDFAMIRALQLMEQLDYNLLFRWFVGL